MGARDPAGERLELAGDLGASAASLPGGAGVIQIQDQAGRALLTARAANLRRFALDKLGPPKAPLPGRRPPLDLRPLACALRYARATSTFGQRLVYERWMAEVMAPDKRPDLKPPVLLRLDADERFPRLELRGPGTRAQRRACYGPLRDKRAAERATKALHKLFPLRPCDFAFEPDPALPLGLGCLYAQVRTCSAPCLARVGEEDYRELARRAAAFLGDPLARPDEAREWLPASVMRLDGAALVVERTRRAVEVFPVGAGAVLDAHALRLEGQDALEQLVARAGELARALDAAGDADAPDDLLWLSAHLHARPRGTTLVALPVPGDADDVAVRLRATLSAT